MKCIIQWTEFLDTGVVTSSDSIEQNFVGGFEVQKPHNTPAITLEKKTSSPRTSYWVAHVIAAWALSYLQIGREHRWAWSSLNKIKVGLNGRSDSLNGVEVSLEELPLPGEDWRRVTEIAYEGSRVPFCQGRYIDGIYDSVPLTNRNVYSV